MVTVAQSLWQSWQAVPEQPAIHLLYNQLPDQEISYRSLMQGAAGYARALDQAGVCPGEVVILILNHGQDLPNAFFGAILHGAIPSIMPFLTEKLLPDQYRQALAALFQVTSPAAVITYQEFQAEVQAAAQNSSVRAILVCDQVQPLSVEDLTQTGSRWAGLHRQLDDIVLLQHSSGTTGLQKGVALSHRAVFNQLASYGRALRLSRDDVIASWLPLYHDMGLIAGFMLPILQRLPLVLMSPFDWVRAPARLLRAISQYRGTLCWLPNFAYNFCAQKIRSRDLEGVTLSSLRAVINCSEPMVYKSHLMFLERFQPYGLKPSALATCYAMAENVFAVTQGGIDAPVTVDAIHLPTLLASQQARPADPQAEGAVPQLSAGRPIDNTRLKIVDKRGHTLPDRHLGEIALQSDCMLTGYYHRPDLTDQAFRDGWYLTGDLGYLVNGELYVTGRKKDLIIVGGKNIYPQDLERIASEVDGVHPGRTVAFGIFNEETGTEDVVVVAEADVDDPQIRERLADEIRRKVTRGSDVALRYVQIVDRNWLLKTSSGKIARSANREKYLREIQSSIIHNQAF